MIVFPERRLLLSVLYMLLQSTACLAQPRGIHLSWNSDKEASTSNTVAITWMNDNTGREVVVYGTDSFHLNKIANADVKYVTNLATNIAKVTLHKLAKTTYYYYKVGSAEGGWSNVYTFKTGPGQGDRCKIIVGIWSDTQNSYGNLNFEQTDTIVKQLSKNIFYFTIHNGDMVQNGAVVKSWKNLLNVTQPINANHPFMAVTGNHDVVNDTASSRFQKPFPVFYELMNLPNDQLNYSYDYGNIHFVAINSGWAEGAAKVGKVLFEKSSQEYRWLNKDLKRSKRNKDIDWVVLYSHYPVYSFGFSHIPTWQQHIKPLVDKYGVDLYLAGHRHVYERHKAIRGSEVFEQENTHIYNKPGGTVFITNGSCGGNLTGPGGKDQPDMVFTPGENVYTYAIMTIEGKQLQYEVYDIHGNRVDFFTINKD
jgi:hypothetical protein